MHTRRSRIAVIGDVHSEDLRLDTILKFLSARSLDHLYCVGDITDGIGSVDRCCELLDRHKVSTVLGNHDQWCLEGSNRRVANATLMADLTSESQLFLESLPPKLMVDTSSGKAMICHGLGEYNMASVRPTDSLEDIFYNLELSALFRDKTLRFVINGHSHRPGIHQFGHLVVINCGSLNTPSKPCFVLVDFENNAIDYYLVNQSPRVEHCVTLRFDN